MHNQSGSLQTDLAVLQGQLGHGRDAVPRYRDEVLPRRLRALDGQAIQTIAAGRSYAGALSRF